MVTPLGFFPWRVLCVFLLCSCLCLGFFCSFCLLLLLLPGWARAPWWARALGHIWPGRVSRPWHNRPFLLLAVPVVFLAALCGRE